MKEVGNKNAKQLSSNINDDSTRKTDTRLCFDQRPTNVESTHNTNKNRNFFHKQNNFVVRQLESENSIRAFLQNYVLKQAG